MCRAGGALWHAFFENPGLVQFMHRMWGYLLLPMAFWSGCGARLGHLPRGGRFMR